MKGLSKRLLSLTMATAMVFSLTAVPTAEASAATKTITAKTTSVQAGQTYTYSINAKKAKNVKISVSGAAKSGVKATVNGKKLSGKTLKGGKTLKVKIKANTKVVGKKFVVNYKLDKKATKKTKAIKVNYSAKSVSLDQTALTLEAGKTATLKATINPTTSNSTIKSWVSSDEKVATVNNGVVTAVAAGTADITVTTSNGKTAKATITVEGEKEPEVNKIEMTSLTATAADTFKATFAASVPADATISVSRTKSTTGYVGVATWNADRTELIYKLDSDFMADTYTLTVAAGDDNKSSLTYEATARKATSIVFTNKDDIALAGKGTDENADKLMYAYVYYDILDQYGDSVRATTSIQLSGSTSTVSADRSTGKITLTAATTTPFRYGDPVSVTVVDPKNGLSQTAMLKVGLEQQVDGVKIAGFVSTDSTATLLSKLPKNFDVNKYLVLYQAVDQQGNVMDNVDTTSGIIGDELTVTTDAPLLVKSEFKDGGVAYGALTYTIGGVSYYAFTVAPGQYADKGGSANLTVISNKTGTKTPCVLDIEAAGVLQSLVLNTPANTVADDEETSLTYTATTVDGETTTNYETIVRSTNELKLSVSVGTLTVSEGNDGNAEFKWQDTYGEASSYDDGVDRPVIVTSIVIGGQTDAMQFSVADKAYPVSIPTIKTKEWTNTFTYGGGLNVEFEKWDLNAVKFKDQYGREMRGEKAVSTMRTLNSSSKFHSALAIVADVVGKNYGTTGAFGKADEVIDIYSSATSWAGQWLSCPSGTASETTESVKYFIGITDNNKKADYLGNILSSDYDTRKEAYELLNAAGAANTVTFTCVSFDKIKNIKINEYDKIPLTGTFSTYTNILEYNKKNSPEATEATEATAGTSAGITGSGKKWMTVEGVANGSTVYIPHNMVSVSGNQAFALDNTWGYGFGLSVSSNCYSSLKVKDLYNVSTTTMDRKDLVKTLTLEVNGGVSTVVVEKDITISDAARYVNTIKFYNSKAEEIKDTAIVDPNAMVVASSCRHDLKTTNSWFNAADIWAGIVIGKWNDGDYIVAVYRDQYGEIMDPCALHAADSTRVKLEYSELTENKADLAHKADSLAAENNNSISANLQGAEIKDVVTLKVKGDNTSSTIKITVGGDLMAKIAEGRFPSTSDETFRKVVLGYTDR